MCPTTLGNSAPKKQRTRHPKGVAGNQNSEELCGLSQLDQGGQAAEDIGDALEESVEGSAEAGGEASDEIDHVMFLSVKFPWIPTTELDARCRSAPIMPREPLR